ncbi:MAG: hypothetical protein AAF587_11040 [Bacteroidota bacterium]
MKAILYLLLTLSMFLSPLSPLSSFAGSREGQPQTQIPQLALNAQDTSIQPVISPNTSSSKGSQRHRFALLWTGLGIGFLGILFILGYHSLLVPLTLLAMGCSVLGLILGISGWVKARRNKHKRKKRISILATVLAISTFLFARFLYMFKDL